jgi:ribosome-associated protein
MIEVTGEIGLDEGDLSESFIRASGPGGQNVNKVASAAQLRFDAAASPRLTQTVLRRLAELAGRRMTREGVIVIHAQRFRSQEQNRRDATERLVALLRSAATPPAFRRKTRPPRAAAERRLETKRQTSARKKDRGVTDE